MLIAYLLCEMHCLAYTESMTFPDVGVRSCLGQIQSVNRSVNSIEIVLDNMVHALFEARHRSWFEDL